VASLLAAQLRKRRPGLCVSTRTVDKAEIQTRRPSRKQVRALTPSWINSSAYGLGKPVLTHEFRTCRTAAGSVEVPSIKVHTNKEKSL
jgi:hypothetical protein